MGLVGASAFGAALAEGWARLAAVGAAGAVAGGFVAVVATAAAFGAGGAVVKLAGTAVGAELLGRDGAVLAVVEAAAGYRAGRSVGTFGPVRAVGGVLHFSTAAYQSSSYSGRRTNS